MGSFAASGAGSAARTRKGHRAAMGARQAGVLVVVIDKDINLIGLTRRADYPEACLMGQAILKNHGINGVEMDSVGFWCQQHAKKGLPSTDPGFCEDFAGIAGLERKTETGLSLVIPYVLPEIEQEHLIAAVLKNYYFPILYVM